MYERFTDRARKVMQLASEEAQRFGHEYVGTEHVLLGLVREGHGVAGNVLRNLDVDLPRVRRTVEGIIQRGPDLGPIQWQRKPFTPRGKRVIEFAVEEARSLKHNYVGTEHLLLGLLQEEGGVAAQVLINLGLKFADVRNEVLNLLGHTLPDEPVRPRRARAETPTLPPEVRKIVDDLDGDIDRLTAAKEEAVASQDWEQAAQLRDRTGNLVRAKFAILREWNKKLPDEPCTS